MTATPRPAGAEFLASALALAGCTPNVGVDDSSLVAIGISVALALFVLGAIVEARARRHDLAPDLARPSSPPPTLYPRINSAACICSGACVPACPEGDVIALVGGRPRLIKPSACVGHGDCLRSCPVSAIELVLGSAERGVEVPVASGSFETTVPGIYVAGEVNGIGLIHNAVAQGRQAAAAALDGAPTHGCELDLAIVGAGPAGLAAALEARRRGVRYAVFEKGDFGGAIRSYPRQKVVMTAPLHLPGIGEIALRGTTKEALLALFDRIVQRTKLRIVENAEVRAIEPIADGLSVETGLGTVSAQRVVLAIGRRGTPRRLGVSGAHLKHVIYDVPEPARYAGERIVVVGGGDSAAEIALALAAQPDTHVAIVHRGKDFARCKPANQRALARALGRVAMHFETTVRSVSRDTLEIATAGREHVIAATVVVCCIGAELPGRWLRGLGVAVREVRGEAIALAP